MKHLKKFENWTTDTTGNYDINYGDQPQLSEISDIVKMTVDYVNKNFYNITDCRKNDIKFRNIKYINIYLTSENDIHSIKFLDFNSKQSIIDITDEDYKYLTKFFYDIRLKFRKNDQSKTLDNILDDIDPTRVDAKKYNL